MKTMPQINYATCVNMVINRNTNNPVDPAISTGAILNRRKIKMEIKFLADGRKVAVVNNVNDEEFIVQEIFIVENNEVPHGKQFVVKKEQLKSSYTATSWHARELKREEERYERESKSMKCDMKIKNREYRQICHVMSCKIKFLKELSKKFNISQFDRLIDFLEGKIKYLVIFGYGDFQIQGFNTAIYSGDNSYDYIKLISIFGRCDGSLEWGLNTYSDGSGSEVNIAPFKSYEDALQYVKDSILSLNEYTYKTIDCAKRYNIELKPYILKKYCTKTIEAQQKCIDHEQENVNRRIKEIEKIKEENAHLLNSTDANE
jgi:hypothetical protein